ncbi:RNA ligase (ATP) [Stackebrandtia soli]|uniref:RNA ligase (ATP) n=1 Tax=Stackebrandtia soli TaxID=1892856 RepID=UPI0039EB5814
MATLTVTAEQLTIHPHPNADALELAQVGLYRAVVAKGVYRTGDWALYIPENAVLPEALIAEFGLTGKLAGAARNRVRHVRLRGELSQGIVCRPQVFAGIDLSIAHAEGRNFAAELGITKWIPPVPVQLAGEVVQAPDLLRWIEIEDIKRYPDVFDSGEAIVATEKIHGSACLYTWSENASLVSSKGIGSRYLSIVDNGTNLYWRAVTAYDVPSAARQIAALYSASRVGVFGEVYGKGVQDLSYDTSGGGTPGYAVFDIAVDVGDGRRWLSSSEVVDALDRIDVDLPTVPVLYAGPYDRELLLKLATGTETVSGAETHLREGLVVRPAVERYSPILSGRAIAKFISPDYLTRKGGTEYE